MLQNIPYLLQMAFGLGKYSVADHGAEQESCV